MRQLSWGHQEVPGSFKGGNFRSETQHRKYNRLFRDQVTHQKAGHLVRQKTRDKRGNSGENDLGLGRTTANQERKTRGGVFELI